MDPFEFFLTEWWKGFWSLINTNFISEVLVVSIFGILVVSVIREEANKKRYKLLLSKAKSLLAEEIKENVVLVKSHRELMKRRSHSLLTNPFFTSATKIILQERFVENLNPSLIKKILDFYDITIGLNDTFGKMEEWAVGIKSSMINREPIFAHLVKNFENQLDMAEKVGKELLVLLGEKAGEKT